jgi:Tfp pilus assembly protein PilV
MKIMLRNCAQSNGFTMLEVLLSVVIVIIAVTADLMWQKTTWPETALANRRMRACQVVEKQLEWRRMIIAQNPTANFAAFKAITGKDTIMLDTTAKPNVTVEWQIHPDSLRAPNGDTVHNVIPVQLIARWGSGAFDTLKIWANVTKNF